MAVEIATAYVNIVPSARGFGRRLSGELGAGMSGAGAAAGEKAASGFGSSFLPGIAKIASLGAAAIGGIAVAAGGYGLAIAANNEQAQISFETMLGSAEAATKMVDDLKKFAASTPFEFKDLQEAAPKLLTAGVQADKVIPILTTLGDVTSGMGTGAEGVKRATYALQQMNAAGRIMAQDLNQLRDAGIPVFDLLAGATGRTKEELAYMAQNGKLGRQELEQLMSALESGKGLEKFSGLMEKQSQSLKGMVSTFKDVLGQGLADAMAPAIPILKESLKKVTDVLGPVLQQVGPHIARIFGSVVQAVTAVLPILAPIIAAISTVVGAIVGALVPAFQALAPWLTKTVDVFAGALTMALQGITPTLVDLVNAIAPILPLIARLIGTGFVILVTMLNGVAQALVPVIEEIVEGLLPAFDELIPLVLELAHALLPLFPEFSRLLVALAPLIVHLLTLQSRVLVRLLPLLIPLVEKFAEWATVMVDQLVPVIERLVGWIIEFYDALLKGDTDKASEVGKQISDQVSGALETIGPAFRKGLDILLAEFDKWWVATGKPWFEEKTRELSDWFWGWVNEQTAKLPIALRAAADAFIAWLRNDFPGIVGELINGLVHVIVQAFIDGFNKVIEIWNGLQFTLPEFLGGGDVGPPDIKPIKIEGYFAKGGRPPVDAVSVVGERGPELFVPDTAGTIIPNHALGGGGLTVEHLEVNGQDRPEQTAFAIRSELRWLSMTAGGH